VNLFVVAWAGDRRVDEALASVSARLPFFTGRPIESWRAESGLLSAAWVTHAQERYVHVEPDRLALFSGRPILWTDEAEADGRAPIDPRFYLDHDFANGALDGRFAALRYADGALELMTDPLGAYPLFTTVVDRVRLVSNNAEVLRTARGEQAMSAPVLAGLLGGGWSLDGHPVWGGIERLPAGTPIRFGVGGAEHGAPLLSPASIAPLIGAGFDPERAAAVAAASVRALADWPGRPSVVPVTGGRDSRLVLGAALAAGIDFETQTGGEPGHPDVEIGRALAEAAGVPWRTIEHDPQGSVASDWRRAAELLLLTTSGTASLTDAAGFPFGPRPGPLPMWHSGQGGEVARTYYGLGGDEPVDQLYRAFVGRRPGRTEILGAEGERLVRGQIEAFVVEQFAAGVAPIDVPDMFYLQRRMGTWAGPTHGAVEYVRDTTSPLWSHRLLRDELGLPARDRARELFHLEVLKRLAPQLVDVPFEDGRPWPARENELDRRVRNARVLARKARGELRRRIRPPAAPADPFARILPEIRDAVLGQPDHPAWHVLDRPRVEALLGSEPAALDPMSRYYAWRLATVFGPSA
jgi:hypothetical protein